MGGWGDAGGGAASGALAGSALGPWGAAAGGVIGGALGYFSGGEDPAEAAKRKALQGLGRAGVDNFGRLGGQLGGESDYLRRIARGQESVSAEQLRQSLQQNVGAQQSMAAGAAPQNSAMAGLQASRNAMNLGAGLAGQQSLAGIQERHAAQSQLMDALLQQRAQELQAVGAGYGTGGASQAPSWMDRWGGAIQGGAQLSAASGRGLLGGGQQRQAPQGPNRSGPQGNGVYNPVWKY